MDNQLLNISGIEPADYSPLKNNNNGGLEQHLNQDLGCSIVYIDE
jgi:hypothetical protein